MPTSRIAGTGSYLPPRVVTNEEVGRPLAMSGEAIRRLTGVQARHWATDDMTTSDLAEEAARQACEAAGVKPGSVDAILVSTTSPDMGFPSTACHVQRRLGARGAAAFDVVASCSGFLYGLSMADRFVRAGQYGCCLVIAAEIKSRFLNPTDRTTAVLFGDGAGAAMVVTEHHREGDGAIAPRGLLGVRLYADGRRHGLITVPAGGSRLPSSPETLKAGLHALQIQGGPVYRLAVRRLADAVGALLKEFGLRVEDLDHAVFHQANQRILTALARRLRLPDDKLWSVIRAVGNTSSASLPIALDQAVRARRIRAGDLVLLGTFGGGLTWATGLVRW